MPQRAVRRSRRLQQLKHARRQRQLAEHLREVKAARIRAGEPRQSIRLHSRFDPTFCYILCGEEGYVSPNDPYERQEFPTFGWRIDRRHYLLQNQEGHEGHDGGEQGAAQPAEPAGEIAPADNEADQQEPDGADAPADEEAEGRNRNQGQGGDDAPVNAKQANVEAQGAARAALSAQARLARLCC
jgi:hypothetical protein